MRILVTPTFERIVKKLHRQQKAALIRKILADDAAIRSKTETWMAQLQRIMQSTRTEQRLQRAYGEEY
jgi:flagellar protein FliT